MRKPVILNLVFLAILFSFTITSIGQTRSKPGKLLNKRYPPLVSSTTRAKKAPAQSISVNEDPVFNAMTPLQLVQQAFITGCLQANNVKFGYYKKSGSNWTWTDHTWGVTENRQMGYFKKGSSAFPIDEGIILTTGIASSAMGPNTTEGKSDLMIAGASDPDLSLISGQNMNDAAVLEFDFIPAGNTMEFKYTFSSEEYQEYINSSFNDAFGFFLSGPGINGTYQNNAVNIAVLPNGDPVTINTIHPAGTNIAGQSFSAQNEEYYENNPQSSPTFQFDGGTVVLTATYAVTPCQTYHIKLCVADAYDQEFDGAVFLAAKSFNSENVILTNYGNAIEGLNNIFEGCNDKFRIERSNPDLSQSVDLDLVLSGTATNGVDIQTTGNQPFPNHVTIPAYSSYIDIPYFAVADGTPDNGETFTIKIATSCPCATNVVYVEKTLNIYENFAINSIATTDALCYNQSNGTITVNTSGGTGNFEFSKNNGLNWQRSNVFSGLPAGTYTILVRDPGSCYETISGTAVIGNPTAIIANAGSAVTMCSGQSTQLNGSGGALYTWSPATGLSATNISNPVASPATSTVYTLTATNASGLCPSVSNVTVTVNPSPVVTISQLNLEICKGNSTTLTAGGGNTYLWNPGGATTAAIIVSPVTTSNYTVIAFAANGCSDAKTAVVTVNDSPALFNVTGGGSFCAGGSGIAVGLSGSQIGVNYQLKLNGANTGSAIAGNGSAFSFGNQTLAGTYTVEASMVSTSCNVSMSGNAIIAINSVPNAPIAGAITQPTCSDATGSVILNSLPTGNWIINPGAIAGSGSSFTISGLAAGTYAYTVTNATGCTSLASANITINTQPVTPSAPVLISAVQPTCFVATGSKVLGNLPAGNWILNPGAIAGTGISYTLTSLAPGTYAYTVTNAAGCTSLPSLTFIILPQPPTPSAPVVGTITQPTCAVSTGSVVLNNLPSGNWTINPGAITGSGISTTVSGLTPGTYTFTVTNASGCTSSASTNIDIIAAIPSTPVTGTITQPTCSVATGSIVLCGLPSGNWTINPGAIAGTGPSYTLSGLAAGTYSFTVTNTSGCVSSPSSNIIINAQPLSPAAPIPGAITQPSCTVATGSVVLNNLPAGNWIINPGAIAGTGASITIAGIATGTYTYTVTNVSGCTSVASSNVIINSQPAIPLVPSVGTVTEPTCSVPTGSVVLSGLPSGNWTLNPGAIAGNTTSTTISGLVAGTYTYTVTQGCTSASTANIVINAQPVTPTAPALGTITQPNCSIATGSVILNGLPSGTWTINPGAISGAGTSYTVSGLNAGTYSFTVTNASGCSSLASSNFTINPQPVIPSVVVIGMVTQPTCTVASGSVAISGLPAGNWVINPGSIAGTGPGYTISGITPGSYTYTVTNTVGCTSSASVNVVINTQPSTPSAPTVGTITQPTCTVASGSVVLNGLPGGNWTLNPGAIAGTGTSKTLTGLTTGTYRYTVTNAVGCTSPASVDVVINVNPVVPSAPTINSISQPTCAVATGSLILDGLPAGNWIINPGAIAGSGSIVTISNLIAGTYNYTVTNSVGCISLPSANIVIIANPGTPPAPTIGTITQPSCSVSTGSVFLTGLPAGSWTINPGAISGSGTTTTISGLATGTYTFTVSNGAGCISLPSASIVIGTQPITPSAPLVGTVTQPTCAVSTGSVVLSGLPAGNWIINPGAISGTGASITVSGINPGTHGFTVTNSVGCTSVASANVVIIAATPSAPIVGAITQPTCSSATGSVILNGLPSENWIINPGAIAGTGLSTTISGLLAGTYKFTVTLGCTSLASASVVINTQPVTPSAPVVGTITQPTCAVSTGSVVLSGLPSGNWTINPGAIAGTGSSKTITGLAAATYNFTVTNAVGCTSVATANVVINTQPITPSAPIVNSITQPTCFVATGSVELGGLPAGNWTINPGAITGSDVTKTISGLLPGTYIYTVTNSVGCTSITSASIVIIANPGTPPIPTIGTITQPTCSVAEGNIVLSGLPAGNWTINPGNITGSGISTTLTDILTGTYNFTITNASGCISLPTDNIIINTQPATPAAPTLSTITQPTCSVATGSVLLTGLPAGNWNINPGAIAGTGVNRTISGLAAGTYTFTVTNSVGCTSTPTANVIINAQPASPSAPTIGAITQTTCALSTGSVELNGLPAGIWTINPGAISGTGISTTISGLAAGSRTFTVTNAVGCTSYASSNVVINTQPSTPSAPLVGTITHPTCSTATGSVILSGLPVGAWTLNPGAIAGSGTSYLLSGLAAGTYNYSITNAAGCTSVASANIVVNAQPLTPTAPIPGAIIQPTCAIATGSVVLSGLPLGNWTINPGAIPGSGVNYTVSGLTSGTKTFTVTNASGCNSAASVNVIIDAQPVTPPAPTVSFISQPTCSVSTGSITLSGLPAGNWTLNPGAISGNTNSVTISGLFSGTYNYSVTNSVGCTSTLSANIVINTQPLTPTAPAVGTIIQPNCLSATGSVLLSGLPSGNWTINPGGITGTGATTTLSGLATGTYSYSVTNASGCTSGLSDNIVINAQPTIPSAPSIGEITQPNCSFATGSVILNGLPSGNWTINPGGIAGTGPSTTLSGLIAGTYNYNVTNSVGCNSAVSANVVINSQPSTPAPPKIGIITQPNCGLATGSIVLNGLPSGNWIINPGAIAGTGSSKTISGLGAGNYSYTVTNAAGCTSLTSAHVDINTQPLTPSAPTISTITQPNCLTATGSVVLEGLPTGNWTLEPGSIAGTGANTTISGLVTGTYNYSVTNSSGCTSLLSVDVVINSQPPTPSAPVVGTLTQPDCGLATGSVELTGLPTGNWTIEPGNITGTGSNTILTSLSSGTYNFTVSNSAGCISAASANVVINTQPLIPSTPVVGTITQPTCTVATGSIILTGLPPRNWIINPGGVIGNKSSVTITGLTPGTYAFTVTKVGGCSSLATENIVINPQPASPPPPSVSTILQPTCYGSTGTINITAPTGIGMTYSIDGSTYTNTTGVFTLLASGTYSVTAKNSIGCVSTGTNAIVNSAPADLIFSLPLITNVSCSGGNNGIIKINASGGTGSISYTISPNIGTQSPAGTFSNLIAQSYTISATDENGCNKSIPVIVGTVTDITLPTIIGPANVTATTNTGCTATGVALGTPVTADNCGVASVTNNAPAAFPSGATTVIWTVTDNSGNKATCDQTVTVSDNILPTITCPTNVTATTNTGCTATGVALGTPVTADNCGVASVTNNAPVAFPIGITTVTWTVTDNSGNKATCDQTVTVSDNILPTITCPTNVTATTNTGCTATGVALGTPVTSDNCGVATVSNNAPAAFPLGITTVTWTVTDNSGNKATCDQTVTVSDNIPPTITCATNVTATTNTGCTATGVALGTPVTADNCGVASVTNNAPVAFPIGITTVTWTVTDNSGNKATCDQTVTVSDNVLPTIACPANVTATTNTGCTATGVALGTPVTADNCGVATVSNNAPAAFPIGITTVTWTVTDNSGNKATCDQTVTVSDNVLPTIACPANVTATTNTGCTATGVALGTPVTADNCGVATVSNNAPAAFPIGITTVTWTVTDNSGNKATCDQTVTVSDNILPTITCPANVTATTNTGCTATGVALGTPVTSDNCSVASVSNNAPVAFPIGITTVTWTVTDNSGNKATCDQTVTVSDNIPPTITCATNVTATTNTGCTATGVALGTPVTSDNCGVASVTNNAPAAFPIGITTVTWTVTDNSGNKATCDQTVTVSDNILPTITCPTNVMATINTGCTATGVALGTPVTSDNCGVASVTNNAPVAFPIGITTVTWTVTDNSGNKATCDQTVTVSDNILPTITCPANVTATTNTGCTATGVALGTPVTSDNCSVASVSNNAPAAFPIGITTVTWTVTDNSGNKATCDQTVTVSDNILPTITCPVNVTTTTNTGCTATGVALGTPVTADNCGVASVTNNAPVAFPIGITTVTWTVTDNSGNKATCDQTVTVSDNILPTITCPTNVTATTNTGCTATGVALGTPVTADNCGVASVTNNAPVAFPIGITTVTWTVTDNSGNKATCDQTVTVSDNIPPTITCPTNVTATTNTGCTATGVALGTPVTADNCGVASVTNNAPVAFPLGITTVTWTVTDNSGNKATCDQTVTVSDNILPTITCPANVTATTNTGCTATGVALGTPVTSDNCGVASVTNNAPAAFPIGITTVTWTVTDNSGNKATCDQTVTVSDNILPTITCPANVTATTNTGCTATGVALGTPVTADNCGVASVTNNAPAAFPIGITTVTWTVTDNSGNKATCDQTVTVSDNILPTITCPANVTATTNTGCTATGVALGTPITADNCGVASVTNNAPAAFPIGITTVTWTVTDNSGNKATCDQTVTVSDNILPTITCPTNVTATTNTGCTATGVALGTPVTADNCGVASVTNNAPVAFPLGITTVTWTVTDNSGNKATCDQTVTVSDNIPPTIVCPAAISVSATIGFPYATGVNLGTPVTADNCGVASVNNNALAQFPVGSTTVTWTVTDVNGLSATCTQMVIVTDTQSPVMNCPATILVSCINEVPASYTSLAEYLSAGGTVSDNDGINAASFALLDQASNGLSCPEIITRIYTVADINNNFGTCSQQIIVHDKIAPVIAALPAETTINCPAVPEFTVASATDNCGSDFTLTFADVTTPGACAGSYSITRTWTATDACGNTSEASQKINIQDVTAPVIAALPAETTINCPAVPEFAVASATDNCGSDFTLTFADVTTPGACAGSYSVTRTWTATDACGNTSEASQKINVQDVTAPVIAALPAETTVNCPAVPEFTVASATDNCGSDFTLTFADVTTPGACAGSYSVTRTWTATDACGNTAEASQKINVQDVTAPVIAALPAETTVNCPAVPEFAVASATDNCGSDFTLTFADVTTPGACAGSYSVTRTWTATDACGNTSEASQKINVQDVTAPVIAALPAETTINCPAVPEFTVASATDNCGSDFTLTFADVTSPGACAGSYSITRTWTATDACGNTSEASQKINVQDVTAPVIAALPAETTINCPSVPEFTMASATDNCGSDFTLTFADVTTPGACAGSYSVTRTWTATDACGNTSEASQKINVQDVTAPVVSCPANITVNNDRGVCGATVVVPKPTVAADCSSVTLTNSFNETADASGLYPVGTTSIVWTVKDNCGNTSTCSMTVTVTDAEAPVVTCPANIVTCSSSQVVLGKPTATDNCGDVTFTSNAPATFEIGTTSVIWTATDIHGNSSTCTQTVTVSPMVTVNAGEDKSLCAVAPFTFTNANATNYSSLSWTHNGLGTLSDATAMNPTYTPAAGETGAIEFKLTAYGSSGCGNRVISDLITLRMYPAITVNAGNDQVITSGTSATLIGTTSGATVPSYNWEPAEYILNNGGLNPTTLALNTETVFTFTVLDAVSGCSESDQVTIRTNDIQRPIANNDYDTTGLNTTVIINVLENDKDIIGLGLDISIVSNPANGIAILDENGFITYTPRENFSGNDTITYKICDRGTPSKCATAQVIITIFPIREDFEIFNLVTPDGDGKNDYWHIGGIEEFPDNEITIFNRWGTKVREFAGYNNADKRWDGTNDRNGFLPDGVYFYIIKIKDPKKSYTGWVYVRGNH